MRKADSFTSPAGPLLTYRAGHQAARSTRGRRRVGGGTGVVRQTIVDQQLIVRCLRHVDVSDSSQSRRLVEGSSGDPERLLLGGVPEQTRPADTAETSAWPKAVPLDGVPTDRVGRVYDDIAAQCRSHGTGVPMPSAAVDAVTDEHISQRAVHGVPDPAAQATSPRSDLGYHHGKTVSTAWAAYGGCV